MTRWLFVFLAEDFEELFGIGVVERVKNILTNATALSMKPRDVITVDGVRAVFNNGWGLVRASNTQPVLVMRFEAKDRSSLEVIRALMEHLVKSSMLQASSTH